MVSYFDTGIRLRILTSDLNIKVSMSTASRCLRQFVRALNKRAKDIIRFPISPNDVRDTMAEFYDIAGFPYLVGAIDCTHVRLMTPPDQDAGQYFNRKMYPSINVQVICNARNIITHVNAMWPGSCVDDVIFKSSNIYQHMKTLKETAFLIGDKGYHPTPFLIPPFMDTELPRDGTREIEFNKRHSLTRNPIEQTFGFMKRRFGIIEKRLDRDPVEASLIFKTCACLHNFAMERGDLYVENAGRVINLHNDVWVDPPEKVERSYENQYQVGKYVRREMVKAMIDGTGMLVNR